MKNDKAIANCKRARMQDVQIDAETAAKVLSWYISPSIATIDTPNIVARVEVWRKESSYGDNRLCLGMLKGFLLARMK